MEEYVKEKEMKNIEEKREKEWKKNIYPRPTLNYIHSKRHLSRIMTRTMTIKIFDGMVKYDMQSMKHYMYRMSDINHFVATGDICMPTTNRCPCNMI